MSTLAKFCLLKLFWCMVPWLGIFFYTEATSMHLYKCPNYVHFFFENTFRLRASPTTVSSTKKMGHFRTRNSMVKLAFYHWITRSKMFLFCTRISCPNRLNTLCFRADPQFIRKKLNGHILHYLNFNSKFLVTKSRFTCSCANNLFAKFADSVDNMCDKSNFNILNVVIIYYIKVKLYLNLPLILK